MLLVELLQHVCLFLVLGSLEQCSRNEQYSRSASPELRHFLQLSVSTLPTGAQEAVGLCCQGHIDQLGAHQASSVLFCKTAFQVFGLQPVLVHRAVHLQVQYLAFPSVEPHEVHDG